MLERFVKSYRRINPPQPPENSKLLRMAVLATVLIAIASISTQEVLPPATSVGVISGVICGSMFSWYRRKKDNWAFKLIISLLLLPVFANFVSNYLRFWYDPRIPLAVMFLWMQVLHSFDLPGRRDLMFSLLSALAILIMGAAISSDLKFGIFEVLFVTISLFSLYLARLSESGIETDSKLLLYPGLKIIFSRILQVVTVAGIIFILIPRLPQLQIDAFPFSSSRLRIPNFSGDLFNNAYRLKIGEFPMSSLPFLRGAYPGFAPFLDLRMRGIPAGELMMKVKSSEPSYYRGVVFDTYNGNGWTITKGKMVKLSSRVPPVGVPIAFSSRSRDVVQTFYLEKNHPNVIFAAYKPREIFFPGLELWMDPAQSLRSPFMMDAGIVYSCVSRVSSVTPKELRMGGQAKKDSLTRYRKLPAIPARLRALSMRLTRKEDSDYNKVLKLSSFLRNSLKYDLETAPPSAGHDAVDDFIFEKKRGSCEQFASALAVMCRAIGISSRVVSGYAEGTYNPFTGFYEVLDSDAHAWVEVFLGRNGWNAFEPTPGYIAPSEKSADLFIFSTLLKYLKKNTFVKELSSSAAMVLRFARREPLGGFGILFLALVAAALGAAATRAKRERRASHDEITKLYLSMCAALAKSGFHRQPNQTPSEFAKTAFDLLKLKEITDITRSFEHHRYGPTSDFNITERMKEWLTALKAKLRAKAR